MATQKQRGTAFEYACLQLFYVKLKSLQEIIIEDTKAVANARHCFNDIEEVIREKMVKAANASTKVILKLEPQLLYPNNNTPLYLNIQKDSKGQQGDVRDILCLRKQNGWEVGLSCKHNHTAVKHSRLSKTIDFGDKWFGIPCSDDYFATINPIFERLERLREEKTLWHDMPNKEKTVYKPLLDAFVAELKRLDDSSAENIPSKLLTYLIGFNDFYKIISKDSRRLTQIQAYNIHGTLNNIAGKVKPLMKVPIMKMPTEFYNIDYKKDENNSKNTIIIVCNNGWTISMRIHNASSKVEPSLKFDINLIGVPPNLYSHYEGWE